VPGVLFEPVLAALLRHEVPFVVVGGVAVVLHGHPRLTADLDLVIDLATEHVDRTVAAVPELGLRPRLPVDPHGSGDAEVRGGWVEDRNLTVLSFHDPNDPLREVDVFADPPVPFAELRARAEIMRLGEVDVPVAAITDLVEMKWLAGRPQDLADIAALEDLRHRRAAGGRR
jgi:hypothetical protein